MLENRFHKYIFVIFIFLSLHVFVKAQDHIQFRNYTINEGLSQSSISCVIQDKLGFLWIGTQDGINRFNGKNFEVFSADKGYDISSEFINTSFRDKEGNLWFGTNNGLVEQNLSTMKISSFLLDSINKIEITAINEDDDNKFWIGTSYGEIYVFDYQNKSFKLINKSFFNSKIIDIRKRDNQLIFVSESNGLLQTDFSFTTQEHLKPYLSNKKFIIKKFIESPEEEIVVSTNIGILYYNNLKKHFLPLEGLFEPFKDIILNDVIYLTKNRLIVASDNKGLFQVNRVENDSLEVINYSSDIFQKGALITNRLNGLYQDKQGIIWIMSQQGLSSFNPKYIGFKGVGISAYSNNGLPSQNVWGFAESDDSQFLYVAADHGVSAYDNKNHKFYHYFRTSTNNNEDYTTLSLKVVQKNKILVGCADGLFELLIDSTNYTNYEFKKIQQADTVSKGFELIYTIKDYKEKYTYLIGTKGGVILYNDQTREFNYLSSESTKSNGLGQGACRFIFQKDTNFYVSPSSGGLYKINYTDKKLTAEFNNIFSPLNNTVRAYFTDAFQENKSVYWFGTAGEGLIKYNIVSKEIIKYDKSKGLPNNVIYGIKAIRLNPRYIWLSTNKGIVALNTKREIFYNFTEKDGLMSNELNLGAGYVSKNQEIYFGGIQGFNYFNPSSIFQVNPNIHVYFSDLEIENEAIFPSEDGILSQNIAFTKKIVLPYNSKSLKLKFFADDLGNPDRIHYKYILKGKNELEEELGTSNELRFSSLAPGIYELEVYAKLTNGNWNKYPATITIELEKPFWLKLWFYIVSFVFISLLTTYWVRKRIEEGRRRQVRLEMRIAERTRELRKKNEKIKQQRNILIKQTEELEKEKEKTERILNNVLPKETARELKKEGKSAAREFKKVSIMFTDFVGFSRIATRMPAHELVSILDMHFSKFDEIIEKNNLEKIKTIGDAYMCAGGVPIRNNTNPINTTLAAVQIKHYMLQHKEEQIKAGKDYWQLRIGINTGSVTAGVIGTKRYAYDIWGSAVNNAQRMEELCEPEKIAVTQATFDYIEPYFECRMVRKVKMKSGINILMYEVISIKPELSIGGLGIEPNDAFQQLVNLHHYSKINYSKAERFILAKLKKELSPKLHYHSHIHSKDVTRQAERIAIGEGITDEDLFLLKSAASFHDAGFIEQYDKNEYIGARMAAEILPKFGYTNKDIKRIKELIFVTQVPHKPKNLLEEIICDADLDYLGRDDFFEISNNLRQELKEHGKISSDRQWDEIQVKFFEQHRYFTKTAIETRLEKKMKHLDIIKKKLEKNNYLD